ncbi:hypothetical protein [Flavobacterium sp.]|uniref:hypothetical protein n=1 Tax=Flavobacterium sp. TaxID=239 RepID=UPI0024888AFC|nr:hypothetical protein [Flavobacterium sp.]MDI1316851.1 hypothetical protein [Flavobacterium sp.]
MNKLTFLLLLSISALAQNKFTLQVTKNGLSLNENYNEKGIQLVIPEDSKFYCFGEKVILGIVELDDRETYEVKKKLLYLKYRDELEKSFKLKGKSAADTFLYYEIHDEPELKNFRVIYFYYDSYLINSGFNWWSSIYDGIHNIVITKDAIAIYNFYIQVKNGELIKIAFNL